MAITSEQIRAARALLGWDGPTLAEASEVSLSSIRRVEAGKPVGKPISNALQAAFERAGLEFGENDSVARRAK